MLQVLVSVNDYERIITTAEEQKREITLIGYLDEPRHNMGVGDLLLFVGSTKKLHGINKFLLNRTNTFLRCNSMNAKLCGNRLTIFGEVIAKTVYLGSPKYNSCLLMVKIVNGLNNYGVTNKEIYEYLLNSVEKFFELTGEKGDY